MFAAAELPRATPGQVDLSSARLGLITETLKADVAANKIPGAVLLIARRGKVAYFESIGKLDAPSSVPMGKDSIFRIYSMSKPITTVAAMMLVEDGRLDGTRYLGPATIRQMTEAPEATLAALKAFLTSSL